MEKITKQKLFLSPKVKDIVVSPIEYHYAITLLHLINNPDYMQNDRTGTGCIVSKPTFFRYDANQLPKLVGKAVVPNLAFKEMLWFMLGKTDKESLNELGVKYWDPWFNEEGNIGKSYGYQFRKYPDQLLRVVNQLIEEDNPRRAIINLWNNEELNEMELPPCFYSYQFITRKVNNLTYLDMIVTSRSCDAFIGLPYNYLSSWFLYQIIYQYIKEHKNYEVGEITMNIANYHLYSNHLSQAREYIKNLNQLTKRNIKLTGNHITLDKVIYDILHSDTIYSFDDYLNAIYSEFKDNNSMMNNSPLFSSSKVYVNYNDDDFYQPSIIKAPVAV